MYYTKYIFNLKQDKYKIWTQYNYKYHSTVAVEEAESSLFTGVLSSIITSLLDLNRDLRTKVCTRYSFLVLCTNFFTQLENFGILMKNIKISFFLKYIAKIFPFFGTSGRCYILKTFAKLENKNVGHNSKISLSRVNSKNIFVQCVGCTLFKMYCLLLNS